MSTANAWQRPCVTQAQIDTAERLARQFGLTYLSVEGYAKLAALLAHVAGPAWAIWFDCERPLEIPADVAGWRVG